MLLFDRYTKLFDVANSKDGKTGKLQEKDDALRLDFVAQPEYPTKSYPQPLPFSIPPTTPSLLRYPPAVRASNH